MVPSGMIFPNIIWKHKEMFQTTIPELKEELLPSAPEKTRGKNVKSPVRPPLAAHGIGGLPGVPAIQGGMGWEWGWEWGCWDEIDG